MSPRRAGRGWQQWCFTGMPPGLHVSEEDRAAFLIETRGKFARDIYWIVGMITFFNGVFWLTDRWLMVGVPHAIGVFATGRAALMVEALIVLLLHTLARRHVYVIGIAGGGAALCTIAWTMGNIGGPSTPWFHFVYPFMLVVIVEWLPPLGRVGVSVAYGLLILVGYFGANPAWRHDTMVGVALGYFTYVCVMSILVGIYSDDARLRFFLARREVEQARKNLERRIEEKTQALRALVAHLDRVQDAERARLARDLHDDVGQILAAQRLTLRVVRSRYSDRSADIGPNLEQLQVLVDDAIDHVRTVLRSQRLRVLEELGLEAALHHLARTSLTHMQLPCELQLSPERLEVAPAEALTLYRCVSEALTNVARHASATRATLDVRVDGEEVVATVTDDGIGIDAQRAQRGFGLLGARERIHALNGTLEVRRLAEGGTLFKVRLPNRRSEPT